VGVSRSEERGPYVRGRDGGVAPPGLLGSSHSSMVMPALSAFFLLRNANEGLRGQILNMAMSLSHLYYLLKHLQQYLKLVPQIEI
jgi:hypothetical protein